MSEEQNRKFVETFLEINDKPKYLFGTNPKTKQILDVVKDVKGVIDELTTNENFYGYPIIHSLDKIEANALVVSCIHSCYPLTIQKKLEKYSFKSIDLISFMKYSRIKVNIESIDGFRESYLSEKIRYDDIFDRLSDDVSKDIFNRIINFRVNLDFSQISVFKVNIENQYFEPFLHLKKDGEVFVDVGGYDGLTSIQFAKHCPYFNHIYFFEPEPKIMERAKKKITDKRVSFHEIAASSQKQTLRFKSAEASSNISENGDLKIKADTLDNVIGTKSVSFIKMDIEGAEADAISGSVNIIKRNHPCLAISVYHKAKDLVDLPEQVLAIRDDYKLYLRHYTEGTADTVMFFVPQK